MSEALLELRGVKKRLGSRQILEGLDLSLAQGDSYLVLGANGAGKSTMFRLIANLYRADGGEILFKGKSRDAKGRSPIKMGGFIDDPGFYGNLSGLESLKEAASAASRPWRKEWELEIAKDFGLGPAELRLKLRKYSMGMRKRLGIVRALANEPELLLLDEPTNGLDPDGVRDLREAMATCRGKYGATILFSSHVLAEAVKSASKAGALRDGRLQAEMDLSLDLGREWYCVPGQGLSEAGRQGLKELLGAQGPMAQGELRFSAGDRPEEVLAQLVAQGYPIREFGPWKGDLELFYFNSAARDARGSDDA